VSRIENAIVTVGIEDVTEGWLAFEIRRGQGDALGRYTRAAVVGELIHLLSPLQY